MNVFLPFDHRFFRARNGEVFSDKAYQYGFFASRYLQVFDRVVVLARVEDVDLPASPVALSTGSRLTLLALPNWTGLAGFLSNRKRILAYAERALEEPSAVIMIGPGGIGSLLMPGLRRAGHPVAIEVVGDPWDTFRPGAVRHPLRPWFRWQLSRNLRKQCAAACAVSYVTTASLQKRYPCPQFAVGVSDVVLPASARVAHARVYGPSKTRTLVCVAVMNGYKGHDVLIDALDICRRRGFDLRAVLVGDGPLRAAIERRAKQRGVWECIRFTGQLLPGEAVRQELDRADAFVLASLQEGMPRALLEAMARALPCVASAVGGVPEVLSPEALIPAGDAQGLADTLQQLLWDPGKLSRLSRSNLERAAEFEDTVLASKRLRFYEEVRNATERFLASQPCAQAAESKPCSILQSHL